jgi:hypothetical protein
MSHISTIGAGMFSDLSIAVPSTDITRTGYDALSEADLKDLFANEIASIGGTKATDTYVRVTDVREFPSMGTPPNIVNVPVYGSSTSQQIQGQSDAPSMEIQINFVAAELADGTILGDMVGDGKAYVFRFTLLNANPDGHASDSVGAATGLGTVENSMYFWYGKVEALQVNPQLTDGNTATLTLSVQSDFQGAFTV